MIFSLRKISMDKHIQSVHEREEMYACDLINLFGFKSYVFFGKYTIFFLMNVYLVVGTA